MERVDRFRNEAFSTSRFLSRVFTTRERARCESKSNPPMHFAGTFAAKEAALKALHIFNPGWVAIDNFEVSHDRNGAPKIKYIGGRTAVKAFEIDISISHTTDYAIAVALASLHVPPTRPHN